MKTRLDDVIPELWEDESRNVLSAWERCDNFELVQGFLNVRLIYQTHKLEGVSRHFARYLMESMDSIEEDWGLDNSKNWKKKNGLVLFKRVGSWMYDDSTDEYFSPLPLVKGEIKIVMKE